MGMVQLDFSTLSKDQIMFMAKHRCRHGVVYLTHPNCYKTEIPSKRLGFFDLETSHLKANLGLILTYKIYTLPDKKMLGRSITPTEVLSEDEDKKLVMECITDMMSCDQIVGFYASRFDFKYIRTRAVMHDLDYPSYGSLVGVDLYFMIRNRFCLHSNSLKVACQSLLKRSQKTEFDTRLWRKALQGNEKALHYIEDHCEKDVLDTAKLYNKVFKYSMKRKTSI